MTDASLALYQDGSTALKQARYEDAIAHLERFSKETLNRQSKQFLQAQMWLVQAYHKEHQDLHAIALCEQLAKSEIPQVKQWADKALAKLMSDPAPPPQAATSQALGASDGADADEPVADSHATPADTAPNAVPAEAADTLAGASFTGAIPRRSTNYRSSQARAAKPKDYTEQVMSAIAHGSISMLASILLFVLFSDSIIANSLGILRFIAPLLIFLTTQNSVVKANAREALNYVLTCLLLIVTLWLVFFFMLFILIAAWPLAVLLGLVLGAYLLVLSVYPVIATILCLTQENYVFRYPDWLIFHFIA